MFVFDAIVFNSPLTNSFGNTWFAVGLYCDNSRLLLMVYVQTQSSSLFIFCFLPIFSPSSSSHSTMISAELRLPEEPEDMWHAYNLVAVGDSIKSTTIRYARCARLFSLRENQAWIESSMKCTHNDALTLTQCSGYPLC